jgi:ribosomal protein L22
MTETDHKKKLHEHQKDIAAKAFLVNSHISPRKMALILDEVRLKSVSHARRILYRYAFKIIKFSGCKCY